MYKKLFNLLPERTRKPTTERLYYVLFDDITGLKSAIQSIKDSRDIDMAYGETLDRIGANVGQVRQGEDDNLYRQLIKVRIIANLSIGDIPTINSVMSTLVKDVYLGLEEIWTDDLRDNEPSAIRIKLSEFSRTFPVELINKIKAAGVKVLITVYREKHQNIYYGLAEQRGYKATIYPNTAEDTEKVLPVGYAAGVYTKKITSTELPMGAWTVDDYGLKAAVAGEKGERVIYG